MDDDYRFWYGVKVWKQLDLFGGDSMIGILQDGGHIILKETKKFLCKHKKETIMKKMGFDKERVVDRRIENTTLCAECLREYVAREATHHQIPVRVVYETVAEAGAQM